MLALASKLLGGPPTFPIGSLDELLIPIDPLFEFQYSSLNFVKAYSRTAWKRKHFCAVLEYVLPVHRNLVCWTSLF